MHDPYQIAIIINPLVPEFVSAISAKICCLKNSARMGSPLTPQCCAVSSHGMNSIMYLRIK